MSTARGNKFKVVIQSQLQYEEDCFPERRNAAPATLSIADSVWVLQTGSKINTTRICPRSANVLCGFEVCPDKCKLVPAPTQPSLGFAVSQQVCPGSKRTCRLSAGNELRLGSLSLLVREISQVPSYCSSADFFRAEDVADFGVSSVAPDLTQSLVAMTGQSCRICLWTEDDALGPLVSPCECVGTMGVVHVQCLKNWLNSKLVVEKNSRVASYTWNRFYCELCKVSYPDRLQVDGVVYDLVEVARPSGKYIVLEAKDCVGKDRLVFVAVLAQGKFLSIGRAIHCDILLPNSSISKVHAYIRTCTTGVFIEDRHSKSGTSLVLNKPVLLSFNTPLMLQTGPNLWRVTVKKSWSLAGVFRTSPVYDDQQRVCWTWQESAAL